VDLREGGSKCCGMTSGSGKTTFRTPPLPPLKVERSGARARYETNYESSIWEGMLSFIIFVRCLCAP
jgi:hypothetical protein